MVSYHLVSYNTILMKKLLFTLIIALASLFSAFAKDRVIDNPVYEFSKSGITHITKIELSKKETRVHVHTIFIPGWWVKFPKTSYIEDGKSNDFI